MSQEPTKYCDLVMKGGITSGIVYPNAVLALAEQFRFKNIGGTSAGAIAAAATAAATLGDRRKYAKMTMSQINEVSGFEGFRKVADKLGTKGFIYGLFQPAFGVRYAYRLLVLLTGGASMLLKFLGVAAAIFAIAPLETLLALGAVLGLGYWLAGSSGALASLPGSVVCAYLVGAIFAVLRVASVTRRNLLGFCTGMPPRFRIGTRSPVLTEWLHQTLQELSGKPMSEPLTFADLWNAPPYSNEPPSERVITLQMITSDISHREPRSLPLTESGLWFLEADFERLFPKDVVTWLIKEAGTPIERGGKKYYELPSGERLPVLIATRMSLSFPVLISAVPLYEPTGWQRRPGSLDRAEQQEALPTQKTASQSADALTTGGGDATGITGFRVCWFSDGGISSNFPIHLFDAALPRWPTFAIDLIPKANSEKPERDVFLPTENNQGWRRIYQSIASPTGLVEIGRFALAIVATMQNWRDLLQARAPGHRDRIAHVALEKNEGGLNLDMEVDALKSVSEKGIAAGRAFDDFSFDNHYWVRWRNLAATLQRYTKQAAHNAKSPIPDYAEVYDTALKGAPSPPSYRFQSDEQQKEAERLFAEVLRQGKEWEDLGVDLSVRAPKPTPQLRVTPIY